MKIFLENNSYIVNVKKSPEGGFIGQCVELSVAISQGETIQELEANIKEAIVLVLQELVDK